MRKGFWAVVEWLPIVKVIAVTGVYSAGPGKTDSLNFALDVGDNHLVLSLLVPQHFHLVL